MTSSDHRAHGGSALGRQGPAFSIHREQGPSSGGFTCSVASSSAGGQTPTSSEDGTLGPGSDDIDQQSTASTSISLFENLNIRASPADTSRGDRRRSSASSSSALLTPNRSLATYRDLFNATPSPDTRPSVPSERPQVEAASPSPSERSTATAALHNLTIRDTTNDEGEETSDDSETDQSHSDEDMSEEDYMYNMRAEELPRAPINNIGLQNALGQVQNQLTELTNVMRQSNTAHQPGANLHELYNEILEASRFEYPATRTVGFIGDSGVGKSSLINSLLDQNDLARSSGDGAACTTVVTEFRHVNATHPQQYTIEADFMDGNEVNELLGELLRSFRQYYTEVFTEVRTVEERETVRVAAMRAHGTLTTLFPTRPEVEEDFLSRAGGDAEASILRSLEDCAREVLDNRPGGRDALNYLVVAHDADDCMAELDRLTSDPVNRDTPAIWPFVKLIRSPVLRTGLVLADLPGFRDLNYARVRATEQYLRHHCDEVVVVSPIIRCETDQSIDDIVRRCATNQPIRIACTRSEEVNARETARTAGGEVANHIHEFTEQIRTLDQRIRTNVRRRQGVTGTRLRNLEAEATNLSDQRDSLKFRLTSYLIERRNQRVEESLSNQWVDRGRFGVQIFCVSNTLYNDHRADDRGQANDYIRLSGITELRRYCQSVPSEAQLRATESFLRNQVPALLGSLNQWTLSGSDAITAERANTLRRVLTEADTSLKMHLTSQQSEIVPMQARLSVEFNDTITRTIRNTRETWTRDAIAISRGWEATLHHASYAAFCRKFGNHSVKDQPPRCWNMELLQPLLDTLNLQWESLMTNWESEADNLEERISDVIQAVCGSIEEHTHLAPQVLESLLMNMQTRKRCILDTISTTMDSLIDKAERIQLDAEGGHTSSYIAAAMKPAYDACNAEYGTGSHARRKEIMRSHLMGPGWCRTYYRGIGADQTAMMTIVFDDLIQKVQDEMRKVSRDLRAAVNAEGEETEAGRDPAFATRLRERVATVEGILTQAQRALRRAKEHAANA